jgi:hypothetical protein
MWLGRDMARCLQSERQGVLVLREVGLRSSRDLSLPPGGRLFGDMVMVRQS